MKLTSELIKELIKEELNELSKFAQSAGPPNQSAPAGRLSMTDEVSDTTASDSKDKFKAINSAFALKTAIRRLATNQSDKFENISADEARLIMEIITEILEMAKAGNAQIVFSRLDDIIDREMKNI